MWDGRDYAETSKEASNTVLVYTSISMMPKYSSLSHDEIRAASYPCKVPDLDEAGPDAGDKSEPRTDWEVLFRGRGSFLVQPGVPEGGCRRCRCFHQWRAER